MARIRREVYTSELLTRAQRVQDYMDQIAPILAKIDSPREAAREEKPKKQSFWDEFAEGFAAGFVGTGYGTTPTKPYEPYRSGRWRYEINPIGDQDFYGYVPDGARCSWQYIVHPTDGVKSQYVCQ